MFNNLIESSSHTREFKRRGSFFLFTVAGYVLLFTAGGVASIYAYDARLDESTQEIVTMLSPVELPAPATPVTEPTRADRTPRGDNIIPERTTPMVSVNRPDVPPDQISTKPVTSLPIPDHGQYRITGRDTTGSPGSPLDSGTPSTGAVTPATRVETETPPPPAEIKKPVPQIIKKSVINGLAIDLPKPPYPLIAKNSHIEGTVSVQVLIDENGKVISAHSMSGHAFLTGEAVRAAYRARFSPTKIGEQPVKVSGIITYNFVLN
ncbi:MAG TPA: TonB family protein [Pyrinomonadaceae bacterium]|nr:TonB family protein [Pyrinomonadaceae bacterium]